MAIIRYKRLVEILIYHEYYMLTSNGQSVFDLPTSREQKILMEDLILKGKYDIKKDLLFEPTPDTKQALKDHRIKLINTCSGFFLGIEVDTDQDDSGGETYTPLVGDIEGLNLKFIIKIKNPIFKSFTRFPFRENFPAIYHFQNKQETPETQFPSLSKSIESGQADKNYQMGMLANINGEIKEAIAQGKISEQAIWQSIEGGQYVNERDRILIAHKFNYFPPAISGGIQKVEAILKSKSDVEIKKIQKNGTKLSGAIPLDFTYLEKPDNFGNPIPIEAGLYHLNLSINGKTVYDGPIYLDSEFYNRQNVGLIDLTISQNLDTYSLLEPNGAIITKKLTDGTRLLHPNFELRFKSRLSYWRYVSNKYKRLKVGTKALPYLATLDKDLVSLDPRALSANPTVFQTIDENTRDPIDTILLPNPAPSSLKELDGKVYSDIYVSSIKDLIED